MRKLKYNKYFMMMPDGSMWFLPVSYIAESRARHNSKSDMSDFDEQLDNTIKLFNKDQECIGDWVKSYMSYTQIRQMAQIHETPGLSEYDFKLGIFNTENFSL